MAGAAVVTATIGPGGTAAATEEETTMVAVGEPALLGAMVATAGLMVTSEGAGQAGANTVLSGHSALPTAASAVLGGGETFPVWPVHTASTAPAAFSSSSLSDPPEELLSEATRGAFLVTHTFQAQGEVGPTAKEETRFSLGLDSGHPRHCCGPCPQESCTGALSQSSRKAGSR